MFGCCKQIKIRYFSRKKFFNQCNPEKPRYYLNILFGGVILPPPPLIPLDMVDLTGDGLTEELIDLTTGTGGGVGAVNSVVIEIDITTDNDSAVIDIFLLEDSFSVFLPKRMAEEMTDEDIDSLSSMCIIYGGEKEVGQVNNAHLVSFCEKSPQPN
ncbi:uncharacterized protein [Onthophagus taurus]|uniref:uncharacterized protein isoform X2 n=1 Tax=Onthophagus taurus TaxID=166361 RepID=UPI0039BE8E7C